MKWVYKISFFLLLIIAIATAVGSLYFYSRVNTYGNELSYAFRTFPQYHFSLIINNEGDVYWDDFKKGALEAAKSYNVAIEVNPVTDPDFNSKIVEAINIATRSKVDGIIVAGENTADYTMAINVAADKGIHIVVGAYESVNSKRLCYVSTNNYEFGRDAGQLIQKIGGPDSEVDLAVILPRKRDDGVDFVTDAQQQLMLDGLKSVELNIASTLYGTSDLLGAEDQIRSILTQYPDIDVIFCTNAKDTVAAAHVIIERNLVGEVNIVGTDVTDEISDYVKKKVIHGVLDRNGYRAGQKSVEALFSSMAGDFKTSYIDIYTDVYTSENISRYARQ